MKTIDLSHKHGEQEVILDKEGMELRIIGMFETREHQILELTLKIIHKAPNTKAETLLRGVARDHSQLKLSGTILIEPTAHNTNSFLREQILLLSPYTKAEAIPNLEIHTDDVKCSHAATISNIPEEHIFYLMSRGLTKQQAEEIIVEGFLGKNLPK